MKQQTETAEVKEGNRCVGFAQYSLTRCTCDVAPVQAYGVAISFHGKGGTTCSAQVDDISCSQTQVENLLRLLVKNMVTPVTLHDVVEDYLASI